MAAVEPLTVKVEARTDALATPWARFVVLLMRWGVVDRNTATDLIVARIRYRVGRQPWSPLRTWWEIARALRLTIRSS